MDEATPTPAVFAKRLSASTAAHLRTLGTLQSYKRGAPVLHAGEPGDSVILLLVGRVKVVARGRNGSEVVLALGQPGDLYGEMAVLGERPRMADVVAVEDVEVRRISAEAFRRFLADYDDARRETLMMNFARLAYANEQRLEQTQGDVTYRLARRLLDLVAENGKPLAEGGWRIDLPWSQRDLAQSLPASETSVDLALRRLRELNLVDTRYRTMVILDLPALRAFTQS
ncbi:Crp/Fnr family transcriptional regulator [Allokutzneria albata]|uniref:cAMP-binding domain of CRP or a regulatory subunit of cAMP-dependent protein kinases n=1 Tax=Allokutzneria albata TaxID=211114 RepID=A0A1G9W4V3_ALLAB|nr:Crp/Fnr family transcriptional regulator [Allokutzneria albata]SDM79564.1 cAMP-binding domain of CRP or a regulatory subunit of cAMP-dependent protein kinases [Allokutzneria albata]